MRNVFDNPSATGDRASAGRAPRSGFARRRRAVSRAWLVAAAGAAMGLGLALGTNVSGAVLAAYGLVLGLLVGSAVVAARTAARRAGDKQAGERD